MITQAADRFRNRIRRALLRLNLAQQFRLASLIVMVLGLLGIGAWIQGQVSEGVIRGTASTTALYVESFVSPELSELAQGKPVSQQHIDSLAHLLQDTPLGKHIVAFKVWGKNGFVLYDTDQAGIGKTFAVEPRLAQAWQGETTSRISNLEADENAAERMLSSQLLETYSPVRATGTGEIIAVAEFYQKVDDLQQEIALAQRRSWLAVGGAVLIMYLLLSGFVQRASDTIDGQRAELQTQVSRLKELLAQNDELHKRVRSSAAQTAAVNERFLRRISAELHDGPAQEISLALLRMDPGTAEDTVPAALGEGSRDGDPEPVRSALRHALFEIRAISAGLGLPELERLTLPEVVQRAVRAHERRTGTRVTSRLEQLPEEAALAIKITVYRILQEGLNNAYRHAGAAGQEIAVRCAGSQLEVEVIDQGPGFDAAQLTDGEGHLGLLGMRERVQSLGGQFRVESSVGRGTRVVACLPYSAHGGLRDG